ncbi:acyl-CoA dehydrogenase family protein [Actinocorallia sp. A-T 12471]|uniref:acyl-CoA dehydrogenase family protein n=1 Tax=Actinocorallia sp. A-T 12471 TaxID=3089813 RepID=UPI0029CCFC5E|nr:acyl-CoA dehydrogenase family protein [Actinocorallia sp. A-T 12471]MDX6741499.1 acyl-CoA dehydrogenase family protein [Actinocorallia sp. A-T 12471]
MDFGLGEGSERLRAETRAFLDEVLTDEILEECHRSGVNHHPRFSKAVSERGWLALGWPVEEGGQGRSPLEVLAHAEELQRRNAPTYGIGTTMMVSHVIALLGTEELKQRIIPRALAAEIVIALGFTEPENGSDAAAAATRAVRDGDGWTITGSKMFTTNAHIADYVFLLARTDPDVPKHRGLTTFLVPMDQPGVEIQEVRTLSGERTNITFYNDVRVGDDLRIGEVDGGWKVMGAALSREHANGFVGEQQRLLADLVAWAREAVGEDGRPRIGDPAVAERIGRSRADIEVSLLLQRRSVWLQSEGLDVRGKGSMAKLFSTERLERQAAAVLELVGADALRSRGEPSAVRGGGFEYAVRHAKGTTIYAGTSEIQRDIIAQHALSLPRPL